MKKIFAAVIALFVLLLLQQPLPAQQTRTEKDLLGEKQIDAKAYYGVQTARALENFPISGVPTSFYPDYVKAFAIVKLAAARANTQVDIVTALNPVLGYDKTTELAKEALQSGKGILKLIREKKLLTEDQIKKLLDPVALTGEQ